MTTTDRRPLVAGLTPAATPPAPRPAEEAFVYGTRPHPPAPAAPPRSPLTTRLRADLAAALKRASLERQLAGQPGSEIQEMLDAALEPWLKQHGYL